MMFDYLKYLLMSNFGIAIVIYLGAVVIKGSFNINNWNTRCNYNESLNNWKTMTFVTGLYFFNALTKIKG